MMIHRQQTDHAMLVSAFGGGKTCPDLQIDADMLNHAELNPSLL